MTIRLKFPSQISPVADCHGHTILYCMQFAIAPIPIVLLVLLPRQLMYEHILPSTTASS